MIKNRHAILALLTALNLVNYLDRFLVMAVGPVFQREFHIGDTRLGAIETAFMFGYMLTSPVFGVLGDRYKRRGLIAAGVAMWSIATFASGLTHGFGTMFLTRVAVGVGEASYATLSPTIIDDIAEPAQKNRYLTIFYAAIPVGSALGYVLGGLLEPSLGWRSAFFVCGGPGVLLAGLCLLIAEPARAVADGAHEAGSEANTESRTRARPLAIYRDLFNNRQYRLTVLGYVAQTFALGGFTAWAAPLFERRLCLQLATGNQRFGYITVVTGLVGTAVGGALPDRIGGSDRTQAALKVCGWSSAIAAPLALAVLFMPNDWLAFVALGVCEFAIFASVAPTNSAVLSAVPATVRANAMAASIFAIHLLGDLVASPIIGGVSDAYGDAKERCTGGLGLRNGMLLLPIALAVSAFFWLRGSRTPAAAQSPR